jgi:hypothetical protein
VIAVYDEARRLGIQRTVHAGEAGPAKCVEQALSLMQAGLAIKNQPKKTHTKKPTQKTQKNPPKKTYQNYFWVFFI